MFPDVSQILVRSSVPKPTVQRQAMGGRGPAAVPHKAIAMDPGVADWADQDEILQRSSTFAAGGKLLRLEFPETRMQVYGDVAVLYTTFLFETEQGGQASVMTGRGTEVFVKRDGEWLNSGWHLERDESN